MRSFAPSPRAVAPQHRWRPFVAATLVVATSACSRAGGPEGAEQSLYALSESVPGVYLYPPLGPEPAPAGLFDPGVLAGLTVSLESEDAAGGTATLATYDATSIPALALHEARGLYGVVVPAAGLITDPSLTYRFLVRHDGAQLARSDLDPRVFAVLGANPALEIGVRVRIEDLAGLVSRGRTGAGGPPLGTVCAGVGAATLEYDPASELLTWSVTGLEGSTPKGTLTDPSGAAASLAASGSISSPAPGLWRLTYGAHGCTSASELTAEVVPPTCDDGYQNQGETGVDCGGPCRSCECTGTYRYWFSGYNGTQQYPRTFRGTSSDSHSIGALSGEPHCLSTYGIPSTNAIYDQRGELVDGEWQLCCNNSCGPSITFQYFLPDNPGPGCELRSVPSCNDGLQNGAEAGVDCGGPCGPCPCPGTFTYWFSGYGGSQQYPRTFHGISTDTHHVAYLASSTCLRYGISGVYAIYDQNGAVVDGEHETCCANACGPSISFVSFTPDVASPACVAR